VKPNCRKFPATAGKLQDPIDQQGWRDCLRRIAPGLANKAGCQILQRTEKLGVATGRPWFSGACLSPGIGLNQKDWDVGFGPFGLTTLNELIMVDIAMKIKKCQFLLTYSLINLQTYQLKNDCFFPFVYR